MIQRQLNIEEICRKLKPIFGKKIDNIYLRYSIAEDREEKEEIVHFLSALYNKNLNDLLNKNVLLEPPAEEAVSGEYPIATVSYAGKKLFPFALREKDWPRHVCISGMSGSGKTNLAFNILKDFIQNDKPFLVFDWKKSFRPLMRLDSSIACFTIGNESTSNFFKMNINEPPKGISPKEWISVLCDLLTESFFVSYGVHKILLETLDESFKEWGVYQGSENYPTWNNIKWCLEQKLEKAKGREFSWLESALRIATVLTFGDFGKVVNYKGDDRIPVENLLNRKVIFELNSLGNIEKKFFCGFILNYIYKFKKVKCNSKKNCFEYAILVDEAHNIFLKDKPNFVNESVTDVIYREMREYGISLICLDQHISKLSDTVKGNSAVHIAFQQQLPQDVWDISGIMQLNDKKEVFTNLPIGSAIVKLSERYNFPFLVEVPLMNIQGESITDSEVSNGAKSILMQTGFEKGTDPEFNLALMQKGVLEEENSDLEKQEVAKAKDTFVKPKAEFKQEEIAMPVETKQTQLPGLNAVQKVFYEFIKEQSARGINFLEIERAMLKNANEVENGELNVLIAMNCFLEDSMSNGEVNNTESREIKPLILGESSKELSKEEQRFFEFVRGNPNHNLSTVELYKAIGLSARKGNVVKDKLLEKGLIKIKEIKNEKGWKKVICPI
ncbi:MAG: DUF87 domain-containing protein [Nanoarchaeota archaeon]|nr:DUF87 domain-containing protein [Nanoarchaeota archaeon]